MSKRPNIPPQIGFDRFVPLDWAQCALRVRNGQDSLETLDAMLQSAEPGAASRKKSRSVLKGLWLEPRPELGDFADRGAAIARATSDAALPALCWGMAITAYPFFGKVAEVIGRLSAIQGDCTTIEVQRRMAETYGERETAYRATNRVIQTQASWAGIVRTDEGRRIVRREPLMIRDETLVTWLIEGAIRYAGRALPVAALQAATALYPFRLEGSLPFMISISPTLELSADSGNAPLVAIR